MWVLLFKFSVFALANKYFNVSESVGIGAFYLILCNQVINQLRWIYLVFIHYMLPKLHSLKKSAQQGRFISLPRLPTWSNGKESTCQCRKCKRHRFDPFIGKIPWSRKWQPTSVFLHGKFHGQRSLAGYSPWAHKDWATEHAHTHLAPQVKIKKGGWEEADSHST